LYSKPAARKASGLATEVRKLAASSAVISGTSISARRGSPSADSTLTRPKARAVASCAAKPNIKLNTAVAMGVRQDMRLLNTGGKAGTNLLGVTSSAIHPCLDRDCVTEILVIFRTFASMRFSEKEP
jgi:hypothetical protein